MSKVELDPTSIDPVDAQLAEAMAAVDWHALDEHEGMRFGLALGLHRDQVQVQLQRDTAWRTATGSMLSIATIVMALAFLRVPQHLILIGLLTSQLLRMVVLYRKAARTQHDVDSAEAYVLQVAHELAQLHPKGQ